MAAASHLSCSPLRSHASLLSTDALQPVGPAGSGRHLHHGSRRGGAQREGLAGEASGELWVEPQGKCGGGTQGRRYLQGCSVGAAACMHRQLPVVPSSLKSSCFAGRAAAVCFSPPTPCPSLPPSLAQALAAGADGIFARLARQVYEASHASQLRFQGALVSGGVDEASGDVGCRGGVWVGLGRAAGGHSGRRAWSGMGAWSGRLKAIKPDPVQEAMHYWVDNLFRQDKAPYCSNCSRDADCLAVLLVRAGGRGGERVAPARLQHREHACNGQPLWGIGGCPSRQTLPARGALFECTCSHCRPLTCSAIPCRTGRCLATRTSQKCGAT